MPSNCINCGAHITHDSKEYLDFSTLASFDEIVNDDQLHNASVQNPTYPQRERYFTPVLDVPSRWCSYYEALRNVLGASLDYLK